MKCSREMLQILPYFWNKTYRPMNSIGVKIKQGVILHTQTMWTVFWTLPPWLSTWFVYDPQHKMKKNYSFLTIPKIWNFFKEFHWNISPMINLLFLKSGICNCITYISWLVQHLRSFQKIRIWLLQHHRFDPGHWAFLIHWLQKYDWIFWLIACFGDYIPFSQRLESEKWQKKFHIQNSF